MQREADRLLARTKLLVGALRAGNLERAKALYATTRSFYEEIEPVAESVGNLDPAIDARANGVAGSARWTGFHHIEQILWIRNTTKGTAALATKLLNDVATLDYSIVNIKFRPAQLANGAVELVNEVANGKITGEEDRYSHTNLSDIAANLVGARKAFELLRPALASRGDSSLVQTIAARFDDVSRDLDKYRRATPFGYAYYGALTAPDRRELAQALDALAEPLSGVAAKVTG